MKKIKFVKDCRLTVTSLGFEWVKEFKENDVVRVNELKSITYGVYDIHFTDNSIAVGILKEYFEWEP